MFRFFFVTFSFIIFVKSFVFAQHIYINEFQALNESTIADSQGEFDDWIELYNYGDSEINISGLYISDDNDVLNKWQFPDSMTIQPGSYLILWADNQPEQGRTHLGFKLSSASEQIILSDGDTSSIIDQIYFGQQYADISYGRNPDSLTVWNYFTEATPGETNSSVFFLKKNSKPTINVESGYYSQFFNVEILSTDLNSSILYTTNSDVPNDSNSVLYSGPITVSSTFVIRAIVKKEGYLNSDVETRSYIFEEAPNLPTVFLVTAANNMWGATGIYDHRRTGEEKPVNFEFYDQNRNERYQSDAGIKIHAPDSKNQQSFRLYAREEYGNKYFRYKFFDQKEINKFKRIILRNAGNDGIQIKNRSHLRDIITQQLYFERNNENAISAFKFVHVFLNGIYWGMYNLRERQDEYYIEENYAFEGELDLLERVFEFPGNRNAISGDWQAYDELRNFINENDLSIAKNYNLVQNLMDIDNFAEYWIFEVFVGNFDWLSNNMRFWKIRNSESKWRWVLWDLDHGLGLPYRNYGDPAWNTLDWSTSTTGDRTGGGSNTILIRGLLENESFKNKFINLFADLLNNSFRPENIHRIVDELAFVIEPDVQKSFNKYPSNSYTDWQSAVQSIKDYATDRPGYVKEHIISKFSLAGTYPIILQVNNETAGSIKLNTITVSENNWRGEYFLGIPVSITHKAKLGYIFDHWEIDSVILTEDTLQVSDSTTILAHFVVDTIPEIIVNEINYHSADDYDTGDWIEVYNPKVFNLDISGWMIKDKDDGHSFTFPTHTIIESNSYLVIAKELEKFTEYHSNISNVIGGLGFGLDNNSDLIRIYRENSKLIDLVEYKDEEPWPEETDGNGYTLALKEPILDNLNSSSWRSSYKIGGTPGKPNILVASIDQSVVAQLDKFELWQNYPNPFNASTKIEFYVPYREKLSMVVFNSSGQIVETLVDAMYEKGRYSLMWNASGLSSGIYFIRQTSKNSAITIKSLLLK